MTNASSSFSPRRTGKWPATRNTYDSTGCPPKNCDFAMKRICRRRYTPQKKWSMLEKWFGARMNPPCAGTFCRPIARVRYSSSATGVSSTRAAA
nr:hypothetical protein [Conexibacter sp. W3-3-2]